jgi:hypothetical protein
MLRHHLSFEIARFQQGISHWGKRKYGTQADAMIRESCLIHLRLLLDFFYPRKNWAYTKYKDIFVSDYLPERSRLSPEFRELLEQPPWLQNYRDQLDWRVAHLTLERLQFDPGPQRPSWDPVPHFAHVKRLITSFLKALPPDVKAFFDPAPRSAG